MRKTVCTLLLTFLPAVACSSADADGDGFTADRDCDDDNPGVHPEADEVCNGVDDDCDGLVDDEDAVLASSLGVFYADLDGDGHGAVDAEAVLACEAPSGFVGYATDCDDTDAAVNPGAVEVCDDEDVDEDCSGSADDADPGLDTSSTSGWFPDSDGDGYGDAASEAVRACDDPSSAYEAWTTDDQDCDDGDAAIHPEAQELCDDADVDEDCDGLADDADDSVDLDAGGTLWFLDQDSDGYGDVDDPGTLACDAPEDSSYAVDASDCEDGDASVNPGAEEVCNDGVDNDCSGDSVGCELLGSYDFEDLDAFIEDPSGTLVTKALDIADFDGDGHDDLVFSDDRVQDADGGWYLGELYLRYGPLGGDLDLDVDMDAVLPGVEAGDYGGYALDMGGDIDGDGVNDLVVTAEGRDEQNTSAGVAYLYYGGSRISAGLNLEAASSARWIGESRSDGLGEVVRFVGDLDADGRDDLLLGAAGFDTDDNNAGAVYLIQDAVGLSGVQSLGTGFAARFLGESENDQLATSVAGPIDANGDGVPDLVFGAVGHDGVGSNSGAAYLFITDAGNPWQGEFSASDADLALRAANTNDYLGSSLASLGDVDGDGYEDLGIGASGLEPGGLDDAGGAYLIAGGSSLVSGVHDVTTVALATIEGAYEDGDLGDALSGGDIDGDGLGDLAVGAAYAEVGGVYRSGEVYLFARSISGTYSALDADTLVRGTGDTDLVGRTVFIEDYDSDGADDLLVGTWGTASIGVLLGMAP